MMRRLLLLIPFVCCCFVLKAQFNNDFLYYTKYGRSINMHGEYDFNSTAIQNGFINKFITGGYLDSATKARSQKNMSAANRVGGSYAVGVTAFWGAKGSKYSFITGIKQVELFNSTFSQDFFSMAFFGNK